MVESIPGSQLPINPLKGIQPGGAASSQPTDGASGKSFGAYLKDKLAEVNNLQMEAADAKNKFVTGESEDIIDVVLAARKADIAFKATMEVRNKLVAAYEEIMRARG